MAEKSDISDAHALFAPMPPDSDFDMTKGLDVPMDLPGPIDVPPNIRDWFDLPTPGPIGNPPNPGGWHPGGVPDPTTIGERIGDIFRGQTIEDMYRDGTIDIKDHGTIPNVEKFDDGIGERIGQGAGIVDGDQVGRTLGRSARAGAAAANLGGGGGPVQQGMNRDQAESVVEALRADRATLQSLIESATQAVAKLGEAWKGADCERFSTEFASSRKQMDQAVEMIEAMATTLSQQVAAQQSTSSN